MRDLNDPAVAAAKLLGKAQISALESEFYLDLLPYWLSTADLRRSPLAPLAEILKHNHGDFWLYDFLHSPQSEEADSHLRSAIQANLEGKSPSAFQEATSASTIFATIGNSAGYLRSELEAIYSLRRQSQGGQCRTRYLSLKPLPPSRPYPWLENRIAIESLACFEMVNDFDQAGKMARDAQQKAQHANYASLQLRALGYLASLDTVEGRSRQSWQKDEQGLDVFWKDIYADDRGYQFYVDLEYGAEQAQQWHLAKTLEAQAIVQFSQSPRQDFLASNHCRLARIEETLGNLQEARQELEIALNLFPTSSFAKTDCQVVLGELKVRIGAVQEAREYLTRAKDEVSKSKNFTTKLTYDQAWAELEKRLHNSSREKLYLLDAISIGNSSFATLKSSQDRLHWLMAMEPVYRRFTELGLERSHGANQSFADWELFRSLPTPYDAATAKSADENQTTKRTLDRVRSLHNSTLIVFAAFPKWTIAWLADDRGIKEFRFLIGSEELERQVREFYDLCSNRFSSPQKVKRAGARLYELLVAPLEKSLDTDRTLFIDSDHALSLLPWPALVRRDGSYWGQEFILVNTRGSLPSAFHGSHGNVEKSMLIAYPGAVNLDGITYDPLPQAEEETDYIASLYSHKKPLKNEEVTTENLLQQLPHFSMFHFGGHAETREYSGDLIVHGNHGGEALSASKLSGLDLRSMKLAVLSACSTGRDPSGLVREFLNAGAEKVIASQWDVQSGSTASLMHSFYDSLQTESDSAKALKIAWNHLILSSDYSHPYYWSAFQIFAPVN